MAKRGRPTKAEAAAKALKAEQLTDPWHGKTDAQVLSAVHDRFEVMNTLGEGSTKGNVRSLIISGAPGIAKTYTVEKILNNRQINYPNFRFKVIKGNVSPINLFKILQDYREKGAVVVLDDADGIFFDDDGVSILKAALDSTPERWIHWLSESSTLKAENYEREFLYEGCMIFITNTDFQGIVDTGKSKLAPHFGALLSRSMYLDLKVHARRAIAIWVQYLINTKDILINHYGVTRTQQKVAVDWLVKNRDKLRTLSIRDAMKIGQMMKADPTHWEKTAKILLLKTEM